MFGVLTDDRALARTGVGQVTHYLVDDVSGDRRPPMEGVYNAVACWGDSATVRDDPDRAAIDADGNRASSATDGHHWATVCPTDPLYRDEMLDRLEAVGRVGDVRLSTIGFPGDGFCRCARCNRRFEESRFEERETWRVDVITDFVSDASDRIDGDLIVTLYPDPYPGNLRERTGVDPHELAPHVDGFLVPLCGIGYETVYWVETLARGFARTLEPYDASLAVQLSTGGIDPNRLVDLARQVEPHADDVVFGTHGTDVDTVREVIRRSHEDPARVHVS